MWPWQRNVFHKRHTFFFHIIILVFMLHGIGFIGSLLWQSQTQTLQEFTITPPSNTVVFLPFQKHVPQPKKLPAKKKNSQGKQQRLSLQEYNKRKQAQPADNIKKTVPQKATLLKTSETQKAAPKKLKPQVKPVVQKNEIKEVIQKKAALKKDKIPAKIEKSQPNANHTKQKIEPPPKKENIPAVKTTNSEKQLQQKKPAKEPKKEEEKSKTPEAQQDKTHENLNDVTFVGQHDLDRLTIQERLSKELLQYWKPPKGFAESTICKLQVTIDNNGKAIQVTTHTSSGSIAFDIKAQQAARQAHYPKAVYNSSIIISLGL